MRLSVLLLALLWQTESFSDSEVEVKWKDFQRKFGKTYKSPLEAQKKFDVFTDNLRKIEEHNAKYKRGEVSYYERVNQFADLTGAEFLEYVRRNEPEEFIRDDTAEYYEPKPNFTLPARIDWRTTGCLTPVKTQDNCGSCWAFSATGVIEAHSCLKTGKLVNFSEQNLIDCSWGHGNHGCDGGIMTLAFDYIKDNGLQTAADYPYIAKNGNCTFQKDKSAVSLSGYLKVRKNETELMSAIAEIGPVSVVISCSENFQFYYGGVYEDNLCNATSPNHEILAVGYGVGRVSGKPYYLLKNSWSQNWGNYGYAFFGIRGSDPCLITKNSAFPLIT